MPITEHTIVVFEPRPRWEPILRWQLVDQPVRVRPCRAWPELTSLLDSAIKSLSPQNVPLESSPSHRTLAPIASVLIDPTEQLDGLLMGLTGRPASTLFPLIVICPAECHDLEWTLRDAGVGTVLVGEISSERLAQLCCRRRRENLSTQASRRALAPGR